MKFRFLALGLIAALAGVVIAHVLVPLPESRALPRFVEQSPPPATAVVSNVPVAAPRDAVASDGARQPVPVLLAHRPAFVPAIEATSTAALPAVATAPPGAGDITATAAKAAIEADGYRGVHGLARGPDGAWKAIALRGQTEVSLRVDVAGGVSAN